MKAPKLGNWNFIVCGQIAYWRSLPATCELRDTRCERRAARHSNGSDPSSIETEKEEERERERERERREKVQKMTMHYSTQAHSATRMRRFAWADAICYGASFRDKPATDPIGILSKRLSMTCTHRGFAHQKCPDVRLLRGRSIAVASSPSSGLDGKRARVCV